MGNTNRWFKNHIEDSITVEEISGAFGRRVRDGIDVLVSLDLHAYKVENKNTFYSVGITPRIRFTRGRFFLEGGLGMMVNNIAIEGFEYRYKWSPQARIGIWLLERETYHMMASYTLSHYSHSLLSERQNVGINTNSVEISIVFSLPDSPPVSDP